MHFLEAGKASSWKTNPECLFFRIAMGILESIHMSTVWVCSISVWRHIFIYGKLPISECIAYWKRQLSVYICFFIWLVYQRDVCVPCFLQLSWFRNPAFPSGPFPDTFQVIRTPFSMWSNPELPLQEWFAHLFFGGKRGIAFLLWNPRVSDIFCFAKKGIVHDFFKDFLGWNKQ